MNHLPAPVFGPLSGTCAVFLEIEIANPFAGQMFTKQGIKAIWIESVARADTVHTQPNYPQLSRRDLHVLLLNIFRNEGREALLELIETTDTFIEAGKGPAFARRGTTDEMLWEHSSKLVIAHLSDFDQFRAEECTNLPVYNTIVQTFSGYLIQNDDVSQPVSAFPYIADYFSGMTVVTAALAALHKVRGTGKGKSINIAMYEVILRMDQYFMTDYFNGSEICPRMTKGKDPYCTSCGLYKCADSYIIMELIDITQISKHFRSIGFTHILGTPEVPKDTQLTHRVGCSYGPFIEEKLDAWLAMHIIAEVRACFAEPSIVRAKVSTIPELKDNPQCVARESTTQRQIMDGRTYKRPSITPKFRNNLGKIWRGMLPRGTDTTAILKNIGCSEADINELVGKGLAKIEG